MTYTTKEIELARQLHQSGLAWTPSAGDYVFDVGGVVNKPSPFQPGVFFVLNYDYFMTLLGGPVDFARDMIWLPTWEQARQILADAGVPASAISSRLADDDALTRGVERETLYRMILDLRISHD